MRGETTCITSLLTAVSQFSSLSKTGLYFQTKSAPFAIHLITVYHSHLKTVHMTFGSLNASNQGCDIEIILFFRTFPLTLGCSHRYLSIFLWAITATQSIFIVFCQHTSGKFCVLQFLCATRKSWIFKKSPLKA